MIEEMCKFNFLCQSTIVGGLHARKFKIMYEVAGTLVAVRCGQCSDGRHLL